jgi:arsenate reductase-like glutaredoxin family protein
VDDLRALLNSLKLTAHQVVSTKSPSYKLLGLDERGVLDEELLALMVQEPAPAAATLDCD